MSSDQQPRPSLLVFADSLAYYGPAGGLPADDPRIWPNIVAAQLGWDLELIGRIGWTCRDVWWAATQDPRSWAALPRAGAVIFATGGMDSLPSPLPTALRELIRYVRPPLLRLPVDNWPALGGMGNTSWTQLSGHTPDPDGADDFDAIRWRLDVWNASAQVAGDVL